MLEHLHEEIDLMENKNEEETEKLIAQRDQKLEQVEQAKYDNAQPLKLQWSLRTKDTLESMYCPL